MNSVLLMNLCDSLLRGSWAKRKEYVFKRLLAVEEIGHPAIEARYHAYLAKLASDLAGDPMTPEWQSQYQRQLFHGCAEEVIPLIAKDGFLQSKQKSAAGSWQRFGPGFYFGEWVCCILILTVLV